ncbi:MAG: MotA/TolQ/ExbB proton channel family protein [Gammaproteobacteria bacterium]|nr:MotA/TolQ/ExbB proton channel family protein [Gammaproteobacteria bacterium]
MFTDSATQLMHTAVEWLLQPVIYTLIALAAFAVWEAATAVGERFGGLQRLKARAQREQIEQLGRKRIERADIIARIGPMLGLMGTLIPLGPGLAALGRGELEVLATAVTVAFDTTVLGLVAGIIGFVLARLRRRWYDQLLDELESTVVHP